MGADRVIRQPAQSRYNEHTCRHRRSSMGLPAEAASAGWKAASAPSRNDESSRLQVRTKELGDQRGTLRGGLVAHSDAGSHSRPCASPSGSTRSVPARRSGRWRTRSTMRSRRRPTAATRPSASTGRTRRGSGTTSTSSSSPPCSRLSTPLPGVSSRRRSGTAHDYTRRHTAGPLECWFIAAWAHPRTKSGRPRS